MKIFISALLVCLAPLAALQPDRVDDQKAREERAELEKAMAEVDARYENTTWAVESKKVVAEMKSRIPAIPRPTTAGSCDRYTTS